MSARGAHLALTSVVDLQPYPGIWTMHLITQLLSAALQQMPPQEARPPQPMPPHDPGVWWTHWGWMLLWVVLAAVLILLIVRLLWPPRR